MRLKITKFTTMVGCPNHVQVGRGDDIGYAETPAGAEAPKDETFLSFVMDQLWTGGPIDQLEPY